VAAPSPEIPFRALADFTYDWESWLDVSGRVRWVNPAITRLTGYTVAEALAMPDYPLPLVAAPDRPVMERVLADARQGLSGNHVEFRVLQKDGTLRWTAISWQPLEAEDGTALGVRTSVRDIDQHKALEQELALALRRAEAANLAKVEFLANVSHELRTPLASILGYTELLRAGTPDPKQKRFLATIASQGRQLDRLVADLLDYSTLGAGSLPLRPAPVQPAEVVREAVRALLPRAHDKGLELREQIETCPLVRIDPARLTQVVSNLLDNAIKYTETGLVTVQADLDEAAQTFTVIVQDTGPGLPANVDLFQPFRQGRSARGGVGLGLAIAARLCSAMGGDLVATPVTTGACFRATFHAPRAEGSSLPVLADGTSPTTLVAQDFPLDILIVDDVASARDFLTEALRSFGYAPRAVDSGDAALEEARRHPPDVTFIDLQMPGRDGWSVARELRRILGPGFALVGASASHLLADSPGLAAAGFDAFLPKPTPLAALADLLRRVATRRDLGHTNAASSPVPSIVLEPGRLDELAAALGPDGQSLFLRTTERVALELPELERRLEAAAQGVGDLRRVAHDLAGIFALLGASEARTRAIELENHMLEAERSQAIVDDLRRDIGELRRHLSSRLEDLRRRDEAEPTPLRSRARTP